MSADEEEEKEEFTTAVHDEKPTDNSFFDNQVSPAPSLDGISYNFSYNFDNNHHRSPPT